MTYVIAVPSGAKKAQLLLTKKSGSKLLGIVPDHTRWDRDRAVFELSDDNIIVPLGDSPPLGRAYGVNVEPIHERWLVRGYGYVYSYVPSLHEQMKTRIKNALVTGRQRIARMFPTLPAYDLMTEIRNPRGKTLGLYAYRSKGEDVMTLFPAEQMGSRELVKLITHELAHGGWHRGMTPEQRSEWITLYGRFVRVSKVEPREVRRIVREVRQMASLRDYVKSNDQPEDQVRVMTYVAWLQKVHNISPREVQDLVSSGAELPVPDVALDRSDVDPPITLYAKSSPSELHSEAVSSAAVGDLADKRMLRMLGVTARGRESR